MWKKNSRSVQWNLRYAEKLTKFICISCNWMFWQLPMKSENDKASLECKRAFYKEKLTTWK